MARIEQLVWAISVVAALVSTETAVATPPDRKCPSLGAIRWDAWFGSKGSSGMAVQKSLGPSRWHERLPTCAEVLSSNAVRMACDTPSQMELEIEQAATAGIGYWAFVLYPETSPMSLGLASYLRASNRSKVQFAAITALDQWGDRSGYREPIARFARLVSERGYLVTPDGRPVLFLMAAPEGLIQSRFGSRVGLKKVIDEFRALAQADGRAKPYIVLMAGDLERAVGLIQELGLDAVSSYAISDASVRHGSYAQLARTAEGFWARASQVGLPLIPLAMTGWDRRPRVQNPVPWESASNSEEDMQRYFSQPRAAELRAHLLAAVRRAQMADAPARAALVYAWNEFDEGGWLAPTRGEGSARLEVVREALSVACGSTPNR